MKIIKHVFCFLVLSLSLFFVFVVTNNPVFAGNLWDKQEVNIKEGIAKPFSGDVDDPVDLRTVVVGAINIFLGFLGIIFIVLIIWAGFRWMVSRGNDEEVKVAKSQIFRAIIGFVIIASALIITKFVEISIRQEIFDDVW